MNKNVWCSSLIVVLLIIIAAIVLVYHKSSHTHPVSTTASSTPATTNATASSTPAGFSLYTNTLYGFSVQYPQSLQATTTFASSYMVGSGWNIYSTDPSLDTGVKIIDFRKTGSNDVTDAELRIGVSTSTSDVKNCTTTPPSEHAFLASINGNSFTTFTDSGAAMSHFSTATSFRTVHAGMCFAIDEFVTGTNPDVYDPPRTAPFSQDQAFEDLNKALATFTFTK